MPRVIEVPDRGQVEFPDGMNDDQIVRAIQVDRVRAIREDLNHPVTPLDVEMIRAYEAEDAKAKQARDYAINLQADAVGLPAQPVPDYQPLYPQTESPLRAGAKGVGRLLWDAGAGLVKGVGRAFNPNSGYTTKDGKWMPHTLADVGQSIAEGATRGTMDMGILWTPALQALEQQDMARDEFPAGPEGDQFFRDYKQKQNHDRFMQLRTAQQQRALAQQGKDNLLPEVLGQTDQQLAEGASLLDATDLVTFGAGKALAASTKGAKAGRALASEALEATGRQTTRAGELLRAAGRLPENAAKATALAAGATEETAEGLRKGVSGGTLAAAGAPALGVDLPPVPGLSTLAKAAGTAKAAGVAAAGVGEAVSAVGRSVSGGPIVIGPLERIASDAAAPQWLRRAAKGASLVDPAMQVTGAAINKGVRGAVGGAAVGGTLAGVASGMDRDAILGGIGSGIAMGAAGGGLRFLQDEVTGARLEQAKDGTVLNWLASKSPEEVARLAPMLQNRHTALKLALTEYAASGVLPGQRGDVRFEYLGRKDYEARFGDTRGAQVVEGETPTVYINTGYTGVRSLLHEVGHALGALDVPGQARAEINRQLFGVTAPDGTVITKGTLTPDQLKVAEDQYASQLTGANKAAWAAQSPEVRRAKIEEEVRAEVFANLIEGSSYKLLLRRGSLTGAAADTLTLASKNSVVGTLRHGLEAIGIKFNEDGTPIELFKVDGQALRNTPEVNAALRQYVRARQRVVAPLAAADDDANTTARFTRADLSGRHGKALAAQYGDNDIFQKDATGQVMYHPDGRPILLSDRAIQLIQAKRAGAISDALDTVNTLGDVNAMSKTDGADGKPFWSGRSFNDAQVAAVLALPDDVLAPSLKEKFKRLNDLARQDGQAILMDYNPATSGGKRYRSDLGSQGRLGVPLQMRVSKAGNFLVDTLDLFHFDRKLGDWQRTRPKAFEAWGGDRDAFMADVRTYLANHVAGRPGSVDLDADPARAMAKRDVIKTFFNLGGKDQPLNLNRGEKDNLIKGRRFDRINRILDHGGDPWPIRYDLQKANFLPARAPASQPPVVEVSPRAAEQAAREQAAYDFGRALPGVNERGGVEIATRFLQRHPVAALTALTPPDLEAVSAAVLSSGFNGAAAVLERLEAQRKRQP